ncbi:MAG: NBR1-Ig-like domain-containing protein [Bacteroidota bacterium]
MTKMILPSMIVLAFVLGACGTPASTGPTPDVNAARTSAAKTVIAELTLTAANLEFTPTLEPSPTEPPVLATATVASTGTPPIVVTNASGVPVEITATQVLCDSLTFNSATVDVNIPDGSQMTAGQEFVKTWKVRNDGSCVWGDGYGLIYAGYADRMSGQPEPLTGLVEIGQEVEVSVSFKAPAKAGEYLSAWQMANARGIPFGKALYVKILVK